MASSCRRVRWRDRRRPTAAVRVRARCGGPTRPAPFLDAERLAPGLEAEGLDRIVLRLGPPDQLVEVDVGGSLAQAGEIAQRHPQLRLAGEADREHVELDEPAE